MKTVASRDARSLQWIGVLFTPLLPFFVFQLFVPLRAEPSLGQFAAMWTIALSAQFLLIAIHELGHATVGHFVDIPTYRLVVGEGPRLIERKWCGIQVSLRLVPRTGFVLHAPTIHDWSLQRAVPYLLGGLAAESIFAAVAALGFAALLSADPSSGALFYLAYTTLCIWLITAWHALINLYPRDASFSGELVPTDGKRLLSLLRSAEERKRARSRFVDLTDFYRALPATESPTRLALARSLAAKYPSDVAVQYLVGFQQAENGDTQAAYTTWKAALEIPGIGVPARVTLLDGLSCLPLFYGRGDLVQEARRWIDEAMWFRPDALTLKGTHASLLVETGRLQEAAPILETVAQSSEASHDKSICFAYLGKIAASRGDSAQAESLWTKSAALAGNHPAIPRLLQRLRQDPAASSTDSIVTPA